MNRFASAAVFAAGDLGRRRQILAAFFAMTAIVSPMSSAAAQDAEIASAELINGEARYLGDLEGPEAGTRRAIYIWRAPSTPGNELLPTLYMADGAPGLYIAAARLRAPIEAGVIPAVQIIGLEPDPRHRTSEYAELGRRHYRAHERWVLDTVIPWAESAARASPTQRAIGGYSNGAAFAIFMGAEHPDVFSGVLAHSPVSAVETFHANSRVGPMRWALSAGLSEYRGYPHRAVGVVEATVRGHGGLVRSCTGAWGHGAEAWIDLSPGAIAWLFDFPNADRVATVRERAACQVASR